MEINWLGGPHSVRSASKNPADPFGNEQQPEAIDSRKAECPCCQGTLEEIPGSKTKCPHCGEFMFVRTRPQDRSKVLVSAEGADRIAGDWEVIGGVREPDFRYLVTKTKVDKERERLRRTRVSKKLPDPTDDEVKWALLKKMSAVHVARGNWGLATNSYILMADFLLRRWKFREALTLYLRVCALDLNGARNLGGRSRELSKDFPAFDPNMAFLPPSIVDRIRAIARKMNFSMDDIRAMCFQIFSAKHYPVPPQKSAEVLILALEYKIDLNDQPVAMYTSALCWSERSHLNFRLDTRSPSIPIRSRTDAMPWLW